MGRPNVVTGVIKREGGWQDRHRRHVMTEVEGPRERLKDMLLVLKMEDGSMSYAGGL